MSKHLGRRQRLAKRKVQEAERQLAAARKDAVTKLSQGLMNLPKRERMMLMGTATKKGSLTACYLKSQTHYSGYLEVSNLAASSSPYKGDVKYSRSLPSGSGLDMSRRKPKKPGKTPQGPRFAPAFMALGHESLKTEGSKVEFSEVKLPPSKKWVRQDKL